jgi:hypothetical protein
MALPVHAGSYYTLIAAFRVAELAFCGKARIRLRLLIPRPSRDPIYELADLPSAKLLRGYGRHV